MHLLKFEIICYSFVSICHNISDNNKKNIIKDLFKKAYDWANTKVIKKIQAYN